MHWVYAPSDRPATRHEGSRTAASISGPAPPAVCTVTTEASRGKTEAQPPTTEAGGATTGAGHHDMRRALELVGWKCGRAAAYARQVPGGSCRRCSSWTSPP